MNPQCLFCGGSGMKVLHRAGDPVPGQPNFFYVSTTYVTCECCIFPVTALPEAPSEQTPKDEGP